MRLDAEAVSAVAVAVASVIAAAELEAKFPYRDVQLKRGVDVKKFYDLEAEIGRGKFGTVYLCREKATKLTLAAKFVGIQRRQDRKNVEREVEIMRTLQHPRLIQLYDAFESENTMVVVLELIEGGELFERVIGDDFILTEKACTIFMRQICEGVAFIHKNNIIHLDLKPENILCLTKTGNRIKIIDFGLARYYEPGSKLQVLFGTPEFVAPEVVNFDQISPATDMWSVGVICYVLLSGLSPFMGDTDVETMSNVTLGRYDFDDESFDSISDNAKDFISSLLLNKKEARMTADQTLEHPWLKRKIPPPPPELITTKENLRTFVDNYHNINGIENNVDHIINTKPSALSAVELIAASDKEFMSRSSVKSFSNDSNENPLPPVRYPTVVTNNSLPPVMNDNNLAVDNVPSTNDAVLNIVNANIPSMPTPSVLDNASAVLPSEPIMPVSDPNLSQFVHVDEIKHNNVPVTNPSVGTVPVVKTDNLPINVPLADIPPRVLAPPEVPITSLPFISKSLPAAAAMLDDNMVDQLKPLHIPLIPTLPALDVMDEPIVVHPPVFSTTLPPPKRGSIDVESVLSAQKLDELDKVLAKRGSIDIISLTQKRGSMEIGAKMSKRVSVDVEETIPKNELLEKEIPPQCPLELSLKPGSPVSKLPIPETSLSMVEPTSNQPKPDVIYSTNDMLGQLSPIDESVSKGIVTPKPKIPQVQAQEPATEPLLASSPPIPFKESQGIFPIVPSSPGEPVVPVPESSVLSQPSMEDVFIPQPPAVAKVLTSPLTAGTSPVASALSPSTFEPNVVAPEPTASTSFHPIRMDSPSLPTPKPYVIPEAHRSPVSPTISNIMSSSRRESPLQKTLDEIPKLSSEILSSLKNMPSLSRTTSYDVSSSKTSFVSKRTSSTDSSSSYSSHERVTSPRMVSFTEHTTSSFVSSVTPKVFPKIQGITLGKTQAEEKSAFAHVSSRGQTSSIKRTDNQEIETSRQSSQRVETRSSKLESLRTELSRSEKASKAEADALAFKQKLRTTAPWFSERKAAENDKNLEKKSSDINALLKENLGPLERSPWAREIRQISAKLVEMSNTTARKQQEDERLLEVNNQQSARRQKFKVSVLNRDVVFGAAREFYIGGEVSSPSSSLKDQLLGKHGPQPQTSKSATSASTRSPRLSPERKTRSTTFKSSSTK